MNLFKYIKSANNLSHRIRFINTRAIERLKSKNDEQNNRQLLGRLKQINVMKEKKVIPPKEKSIKNEDQFRRLSTDIIQKIIKSHFSDPLSWNCSILSRIYNVPESYCEQLLLYVRPFVYYTTSDMDESKQLVKAPIVIDVERLQNDKKYLPFYQALTFVDSETTLNVLSDYDSSKP